jgi:protease I
LIRSLFISVIILVLSCGSGGDSSGKTELEQSVSKSVLIVIAPKNFHDDEFSSTYDSLAHNDVRITVASTDTAPATGMFGTVIKPDIPLEKSNATDFDALIIIGGSGCEQLWDNENLHAIIRNFDSEEKLIAAMCIAPMVLARAGILVDKIVTAYPAVRDEIGKCCMRCTDAEVEISGNIITCSQPKAAASFAKSIIGVLKQ